MNKKSNYLENYIQGKINYSIQHGQKTIRIVRPDELRSIKSVPVGGHWLLNLCCCCRETYKFKNDIERELIKKEKQLLDKLANNDGYTVFRTTYYYYISWNPKPVELDNYFN